MINSLKVSFLAENMSNMASIYMILDEFCHVFGSVGII